MRTPLSPSKMPAMLPGVIAIWWEVRGYGGMLQPIQVMKETTKTLRTATLDHANRVYHSTRLKTCNMFPTWAMAYESAKAVTRANIERHKRSLAVSEELLGDLENLKEPNP